MESLQKKIIPQRLEKLLKFYFYFYCFWKITVRNFRIQDLASKFKDRHTRWVLCKATCKVKFQRHGFYTGPYITNHVTGVGCVGSAICRPQFSQRARINLVGTDSNNHDHSMKWTVRYAYKIRKNKNKKNTWDGRTPSTHKIVRQFHGVAFPPIVSTTKLLKYPRMT